MKAATYISTLALAAAALGAAGCGSSHEAAHATGGTLTVYESLPMHGTSARAADAAAAGARLALADARGRAAGRHVRLVELDSAAPGDETWNPATVEANARRAAADPTAIAYLGELDGGGSAISVPVTNDAGILQVSPGDGLTSLTRDEPGAPPATGPDRYYPSGTRTFLRLVPNDYEQAMTLLGWASAARSRPARRIVLVQDETLFGRELATQARYGAAGAGLTVADVVEAQDDPTGYPALARRVAAERPDAVVYTGVGGPHSGLLLAAIERARPGLPLYGGSGLAGAEPPPRALPPVAVLDPTLPAARYGARARRVIARLARQRGSAADPEALYGYEAMRVVLDAIAAAGKDAGRRASVVHAALAPRARRSLLGDYRVLASGDVSTARFGSYRRRGGSLAYLGTRGPPEPR